MQFPSLAKNKIIKKRIEKMKITKKNSKGLKREFNIVISAKEIEDKINEKLSEIALTARIPGFRPGKIPNSILKARIGKEVRGEVFIMIDDFKKLNQARSKKEESLFANPRKSK